MMSSPSAATQRVYGVSFSVANFLANPSSRTGSIAFAPDTAQGHGRLANLNPHKSKMSNHSFSRPLGGRVGYSDEDHVHDHGDPTHEHGEQTEAERLAMAEALWRQQTLRLVTVGIDIGSATSHLVFARVLFQRQGHRGAARFVPVERLIHWRSPIMLTPFQPDGTIDADALSRFVRRCYADAGLAASDVDTGAVILTGEAIKRRNARAITEIFAGEAGKIVTASAGHRLESTLAAHGSGATALSAARGACGLHVDIGGGTTKLALVDQGEVLGVAAFAVGGRLIARDAGGRWTRVDESAVLTCAELGIETSPDSLGDPG